MKEPTIHSREVMAETVRSIIERKSPLSPTLSAVDEIVMLIENQQRECFMRGKQHVQCGLVELLNLHHYLGR